MLNTVFEKEVCGRCAGTGHHSYNQVDGSVCYGCGGKGERLTKRGAEASKFFKTLNMKRADAVEIGDVIENQMFNGRSMSRYYAPVVEIGDYLSKGSVNGVAFEKTMVRLGTEHAKVGKHGSIVNPDTMLYVRPATEEVRQARLKEALAYQETLTKTGKPRKR